jgi:protein-S-isoprenylcysteine O-methyltransferase Ste14
MSTNTFIEQNKTYQLENGVVSKILGLAYALLSYSVGAGALFWLFFAAAGFVPYGLSEFRTTTVPAALLIDAGLVFLFALQHTVMARKGFKQKWTRLVPHHLERSTFVLVSGIFMAALLWFWQPLPGSIWSVTDTAARLSIQGISLIGVAYVLFTSFVTNHFELFGLRQPWLYANDKPYTPLEFKRHWVYRYSRHPMMLGILVILWAAPEMTVTRLALAVLLTAYLFTGIKFEEHGLIQEFGDKYREYKKEIGLFFTFS